MRYTNRLGVGINYPDRVIFAFCPQYIELTGAKSLTDSVVFSVSGRKITVPVYSDTLRVDISTLVQLIFGDMRDASPMVSRYKQFTTIIKYGGGSLLYAFTCTAIWGAIEPLGRVGQYGLIHFDQSTYMYRRAVRWFKAYPFAVEFITGTNQEVQQAVDGGVYGSPRGLTTIGIHQENVSSLAQYKTVIRVRPQDRSNVWDGTFDFTFSNIVDYYVQEYSVTVDERKDGYYMRWVDGTGLMQYYLFDCGTDAVKTSDTGTTSIGIEAGGFTYNEGSRVYGKTKEHTKKICATMVPEDEQALVQSIGESIMCDMYAGKDNAGRHLWMPVIVKPSTMSVRECRGMQDIEIEIEIPSGAVQRL